MPKYVVIHGSLSLPGKPLPPPHERVTPEPIKVGIGESVELTEAQARQLVADGFLTDEKKFSALKKSIEATEEAGTPYGSKAMEKLARGLKAKG
jgi:hypothetical protein